MKQRIFYLLSVFTLLIGVCTQSAAAESTTAGTGQALEIAPPLVNISANPGASAKSSVKIRDVSAIPLTVSNEINDFTADGEDGTPRILTDTTKQSPYSLKDWIKPIPKLSLKPREIVEVPITITVPSNASPGGYYAVVRFTAQASEPEKSGVSLSASLGALVFLKVNGEAKENLSIVQFATQNDGDKDVKKTNWLFESSPVQFLQRVKNSGTIHLQPTGQVTVKDAFGKVVATVNVNLSANTNNGNVLPDQTRAFISRLDSSVIGNRVLFGHYTADLALTYGSKGKTVTASTAFWVIPYKLILFIIFAFIVLFFAFRRGLGRYNEKIIEKSRGRRRR